MTVLLTSTVVVLGPSAADNNACAGTVLPLPSGMPSAPALEIDAIAAPSSRAPAARVDIGSKARNQKSTTNSPIAFEAVRKMDAIFMLERSINGLSPEQRVAVR
jgi:hypothetical protein